MKLPRKREGIKIRCQHKSAIGVGLKNQCSQCYPERFIPPTSQGDWREELENWIKTQHGSAGWQQKLENLIESLLDDQLISLENKKGEHKRIAYQLGFKEATQGMIDSIQEKKNHVAQERWDLLDELIELLGKKI